MHDEALENRSEDSLYKVGETEIFVDDIDYLKAPFLLSQSVSIIYLLVVVVKREEDAVWNYDNEHNPFEVLWIDDCPAKHSNFAISIK